MTAWLADLVQDARVGSRALRRTPIFTTIAIVTLACAIGANTAIFSLLRVLVLRDLPVREPASLVQFLSNYPGDPPLNFFSMGDYERYRDQNHVFSAMLGTARVRLTVQPAGGTPETLGVECVTGNFFNELGIRSEAGRVLDERDVRLDAPVSAVVSSSYWNARFNRSSEIVGTNLTVADDVPAKVVGVADARFSGLTVGYATDVWVPASACGRKGPIILSLVARLKPGVPIEQAQAEMRVLDRTRIEEFAKRDPTWRRTTLDVVSAHAGLSTPVHQQFVSPLFVLMALVAVLLVLACANLGSMLLARGAARQQEMAVRVSLGAGRVRIARQMLIESLMLAVAGGAIGSVAAYLGARSLMTIMTGTRMIGPAPRIDVAIDASVLVFTAALMALATMLFGLVPAWTAFISDPAGFMRPGSEAARPGSRVFGNALVVTQVALSVALVTVAALTIGRLSTLRDARSLGFDSSSVLLMTLDARDPSGRQAVLTAYQTLLDHIESMPGVVSATMSGMTPISGAAGSRFVTVEGFREEPQARRRVSLNNVTARFFETFRTPLVAGRDFTAADLEGGRRVAIINLAAARYYFNGRNPLGAHFQFDNDSRLYEIVGVVADAKYSDVRVPAPRTIYLHSSPNPPTTELSVRTDGPGLASVADVRRLVAQDMPGVSISKVTSLAAQVDASVVPERFIARLSSFFGSAGMLLAAVGLYGLLAFMVARRTREVGIRVALGAQQRDVMILVLRRAFALVAIGLVIGTPIAFMGARVAANMIGAMPTTPPMVVAVLATFAVTLLAAYVPARRATRVDPLVAMRAE